MFSLIRSAFAVALGTISLFLISALSQFLPWSTPSVLTIDATSKEPYVFSAPNLQRVSPGALTTENFDKMFAGHIATLATDQSFSWVLSIDRKNYSAVRFFSYELATQILVALGLFGILRLLGPFRLATYLLTVATTSMLTGLAIYLTLINWWGLPILYGVGAAISLTAGWTLAALIIFRVAGNKLASKV